MGGTFDPIHYGHLVTAEEALGQFGLDEVVFVPTGRPWMKPGRDVSPAEDRYLMTVIATASNPSFRVSRVEIDREGPTYTVDTLRTLGADNRTPSCTSSRAPTRCSRSGLEGSRRGPGDRALHRRHAPRVRPRAVRDAGPARSASVSMMSIPALAISSTDVRGRIREGGPIRYLVPEGVQTYIEKAALYR